MNMGCMLLEWLDQILNNYRRSRIKRIGLLYEEVINTTKYLKDKKIIYNISSNSEETIVVEKIRDKITKQKVKKRKAINDYSLWMGGVDRFDSLCSRYNLYRNTKKWWKSPFFF